MAGDSPRPPKRSWRQDAGAPEKTRGMDRGWRKEAEAPPTTAGWSRGQKLTLAGAGILVTIGGLIAVILWLIPPKPACLVLLGAGYEDNLAVPHNVHGWSGLQDLAQLAGGGITSMLGGGLLNLKHEPRELRSDVDWSKGWDRFEEKTVVVFLALHGGADTQGAYFYYADADPRTEDRLRLAEVLDRLEALPRDKNKVLILDAAQVPAHWPSGMLHNDFPRALRDLRERIDSIPNLVVLSACDVDQRSWASQEWRRTVFTHYLIEGLKGAADADGNGRVDLLELFGYVRSGVESWARANRDALQTPVLLGDEETARRIELVLVKERYHPPDPRSGQEAFQPPAELRQAWETARRLERESPSPAVYSPHLWRQYRDLLLRYEQLLRAGDSRKVADVKQSLGRLEKQVALAQRLEIPSVQTALPMPLALGIVPTSPTPAATGLGEPGASATGAARLFNDLWNAPPQEREALWRRLVADATDRWDEQGRRLEVCGLLLDRAAENPRDNLAKAVALLSVINSGGNQRPVEAHYLAMLHRDLSTEPAPPDDLVAGAIRVRRLAERTVLAVRADAEGRMLREHPYSEEAFRWLAARTAHADTLRRKGEDLLFAADHASWTESRTAFRQAEDLYQAAARDAEVVRLALRTRDEAFSVLPYYSDWLARRRTPDEGWLRRVEGLWQNVHYLARQLETPDPDRLHRAVPLEPGDLRPRSITDQAAAVRQTLADLEQHFASYCQELSSAALQSVWRDAEDALAVPAIDPDLRMTLLGNAAQTSLRFHLEHASAAPGREAVPSTPEKDAEQARAHAYRQGRMALAVLGSRWFDDDEFRDARSSFLQTSSRVQNFLTEEGWRLSLAAAGEEIALRCRKAPSAVERLTAGAQRGRPQQAVASLEKAAQLSRLLNGAAAASLAGNPADEYRRLRVHDWLLHLADRTLHDHWFAEDPRGEPYYRHAGNLFLQDARTAAVPRDDLDTRERHERLADVAALEERLQRPGELSVIGPARVDVTSEMQVVLDFRLHVDDKAWVPAGFPVVWVEAGRALLAPEGSERRFVRELHAPKERAGGVSPLSTGPADSFLFRTEPESPPPLTPGVLPTSATFHGLYRGQILRRATEVRLHRLPHVVMYQQPVPPAAGLAVRADPAVHNQFAAANGALAIVLDCSGSMWEGRDPAKYDRNTPCRYHDVTNALKEVLQRLPQGTHVSVTVFSHLIRDPNTGRPLPRQPHPNDTIQMVRPPRPWNRAELSGLMDILEPLVPWNETPIVRAMHMAKRDGFPPNFKGFKTMLVLTDGEDNLFKDDAALHRLHGTKDIPTFLDREFRDFGAVINFIGFQVAAGEQETLVKQFKNAIENLPLKGSFFTVDRTDELTARLEKLMRQELRFRIEREAGGFLANMPEEGWEVSRDTDSDRWVRLEPGTYKIRVQTDRVLEQRVQLARGEFLLATVRPDGLGFERALYGRDYAWKPSLEQDGWLLTVHQNQLKPDRSLEMLLTLENRTDRDPRQGTLRQVEPRTTWVELAAPGAVAPLGVRWGPAAGYPAPAWQLRVGAWPARAGGAEPTRPAVTIWWNAAEEAPAAASLPRPPDADLENAFRGREVQVGRDVADKAVVESLQVEEHLIETQPGRTEKVSCLVVRLAHAPGKPVWVQVSGLDAGDLGVEHRFYSEANKYTGVFWPVTRDEARDKVRALNLISLDSFKNARTTSKIEFPLKDLPDARTGPRSILELLEDSARRRE